MYIKVGEQLPLQVSPCKACRSAPQRRNARKNPLTPFFLFQMNALSVGTSKDSTDSAPVVNNVYEEPLGNGAGDSGDEATYQIPPSNKPVYEAPPSTLYQVSRERRGRCQGMSDETIHEALSMKLSSRLVERAQKRMSGQL